MRALPCRSAAERAALTDIGFMLGELRVDGGWELQDFAPDD
jgi:hypothetical protein